MHEVGLTTFGEHCRTGKYIPSLYSRMSVKIGGGTRIDFNKGCNHNILAARNFVFFQIRTAHSREVGGIYIGV